MSIRYFVKHYGQVSEVQDVDGSVHAIFTNALGNDLKELRAEQWADEQNKKEVKG